MLFHQFEMIWAANQHNWIDCSTKQQENGEEDLYGGCKGLAPLTRCILGAVANKGFSIADADV